VHKVKFYLISLSVLLILSIGALIWLTNSFTPDKAAVIAMFYGLIALMFFSGATLLGFYLRRVFGQREFLTTYVTTASRQGFWLSMILVVSLLLLHQGWFTWLNAMFLIFVFIFLELFLLSRD
jgi:hypothetical protein